MNHKQQQIQNKLDNQMSKLLKFYLKKKKYLNKLLFNQKNIRTYMYTQGCHCYNLYNNCHKMELYHHFLLNMKRISTDILLVYFKIFIYFSRQMYSHHHSTQLNKYNQVHLILRQHSLYIYFVKDYNLNIYNHNLLCRKLLLLTQRQYRTHWKRRLPMKALMLLGDHLHL